MIEERQVSRYKKGDIVRIVDAPYMECPFTWVEEMNEFCGQEATIISVFWVDRHNTYGYELEFETDDNYCTWCENCFSVEPDLVESDLHPLALFQ